MDALSQYWQWIAGIGALGLVYAVAKSVSRRRTATYEPHGRLLNRPTLRLWKALDRAGNGDWLVLPSVCLNRLVQVEGRAATEEESKELASHQLDFALLDPADGETLAVVKLDLRRSEESESDAESENENENRELDWLVDRLDDVEIPLLIVEGSKRYKISALRELIDELVEYE